jgi:dienelactone hydrolase
MATSPRLTPSRLFPGLALTLLAAVPAPASAQGDMLLLMRGPDTVAVETLRRAPGRLDVELVDRSTKARMSMALTLTPSAQVVKMENQYRRADADPGTKPIQSAVLVFVGDSVIAEITNQGGTTRTQRIGTRAGAVPYVNPSFAILEIAVVRLLQAGVDSLAVPIFMVAGGSTLNAVIRRASSDSAIFSFAPGMDARLAVDRDGRILGGTIPTQGLTIVRGTASQAALFVPPPDYSAPAGAPYTAEDVTVPTPMGHSLAGTLTLPRGAGPFPAIVTITGSGSQERDEEIPMVRGYRPFRQIADTLSRMGIAVLRMDDRGVGGSGGNARTATSEDFAKDIEAGVAYLRARKEIDGHRIGLLGHSEGGLIAPMVAAKDPSLRAIVLMAGQAQTGRAIISFQNQYAIEHSPAIAAGARDSALAAALRQVDSIAATSPWIRFFLDYDPLVTARKVRVPTLILQGATDQQVTPEQAEVLGRAIRSGGNRNVTVLVFPETNHLFLLDPSGNPSGYSALGTSEIRPEVIATLTEWLAKALR